MMRLFGRRLQRPEHGMRVYAVGDVHGRLDLLDALLALIEEDGVRRGDHPTRLIFLGDYVDRGPDSAGVIDHLMTRADAGATCLMGNHEEVLLAAADGSLQAAGLFARIGGRETLLSYGVSASDYDAAELAEMAGLIAAHIPRPHLDWLRGLPASTRSGDYLFVHAGIRPGVPLNRQDPAELRWIRDAFLLDDRGHGAMIIHGHSITDDVDAQHNRIGIDTGAYATGRLTAIGLEGDHRWFLTTGY